MEGFDKLVEGGIRRGTNVLVTGIPGTGKTIFGLDYLYKGTQKGENGLYISIDSTSEPLKVQGRASAGTWTPRRSPARFSS